MGKFIMLKATIVSGIMAGSIAFGALTTYNGGAAITVAKNTITQQANELGVFKSQQGQLLTTLKDKQARLDYLEENGTERDQAEIKKLNDDITALNANIDSAGGQITDTINQLEGEITKANDDATALEQTVADAGTMPEAAYQSEIDYATGAIPDGVPVLRMINGTPQIVYAQDGSDSGLKIDKTTTDVKSAHLVVINNSMKSFIVTVDGKDTTVQDGTTVDFGLVETLDAKTLSIKNVNGLAVGQYYLTASNTVQ